MTTEDATYQVIAELIFELVWMCADWFSLLYLLGGLSQRLLDTFQFVGKLKTKTDFIVTITMI